MTDKKSIPFYFAAAVIFVLLKFWYTLCDAGNLLFLLQPTSNILELMTNSDAVFVPGTGFYNEKFDVVIEKSCSGFNFWLLCFLMLAFSSQKFIKKTGMKALSIPLCLLISLALTIFSNASRISLSIIGQHVADRFLIPRPHLVLHSAIGTFIYLFFLIIIYISFEFTLNKLKPIHEKPSQS